MKVSFLGAGKVGLEVIRCLVDAQDARIDELVIIDLLPNRIIGYLKDLESAYWDKQSARFANFKITASDNFEHSRESDLIIIAAAKWPTPELKQKYSAYDPSGRLVQSIVNAELIKDCCQKIRQLSPKATVFVLTNQADMMSAIARPELPGQSVIGIGNLADSRRFQYLLSKHLWEIKSSKKNPPCVEAHIAGFHNQDMFLLKETLLIDGKKPDFADEAFSALIKRTLESTIQFGKEVSQLQKNPAHPQIDTGSCLLPARVIADVIQAFTSQMVLTGSFNVTLSGYDATHYGVPENSALSIPIKISNGRVDPLVVAISDEEKELCRKAQANLFKDTEKIQQCLQGIDK